MRNRHKGIVNSFLTNITNGFTEDCGNKIKVLKINVYGCLNFRRFRNCIIHMFSCLRQIKSRQPRIRGCLRVHFDFFFYRNYSQRAYILNCVCSIGTP